MSAQSPMTAVNAGRLLARHGLWAESGASPCAIHPILASKKEFPQVRRQLAALLAQRGPFNVPFMFESGHLQGRVHHSDVPQAA
jgi:putative modified peptide